MPRRKVKTKIIYEPGAKAREYGAKAANLYRNCPHGCAYCYAPGALKKSFEEFNRPAEPRFDDILETFREDCQIIAPPVEKIEPLRVFMSFSCDPYNPAEEEHKLTRQAIGILHDNKLRAKILTKAGDLARRDFDILKKGDLFGVTLTFLDEDLSRAWEPNAAPPGERIASLAIAHANGITTWASLEPVIDAEQSLELITWAAPFVDEFRIGKMNYEKQAAARGAPPREPVDWFEFKEQARELLIKLEKNFAFKTDLLEAARRHSRS